jgi:hypothetical protein
MAHYRRAGPFWRWQGCLDGCRALRRCFLLWESGKGRGHRIPRLQNCRRACFSVSIEMAARRHASVAQTSDEGRQPFDSMGGRGTPNPPSAILSGVVSDQGNARAAALHVWLQRRGRGAPRVSGWRGRTSGIGASLVGSVPSGDRSAGLRERWCDAFAGVAGLETEGPIVGEVTEGCAARVTSPSISNSLEVISQPVSSDGSR